MRWLCRPRTRLNPVLLALGVAVAGSTLDCASKRRHFPEATASGGSAGSTLGGGNTGSGGEPGSGGTGARPPGSGGSAPSGGGSDATGGASGASGGASCLGSARDLRLWKLHLGERDYVTLKNISDCAIELEGLSIVFDDRDDFPDPVAFDCTLVLPSTRLPPHASVRVHERAWPGDIHAIEDNVAVTPCDAGITFNPQRGGVTYLCADVCAAETVIDVVAHQGYDSSYGEPPALRHGVAFASPLSGVSANAQDSIHYRRSATAGDYPRFLGSDWALEQRTLYADFEAGLELVVASGETQAWEQEPGQAAELVSSSTTSAMGSSSLRITQTGADGVSTALRATLAADRQPREFSYFARVESSSVAAGYFELLMAPLSAVQLSFEPNGLGAKLQDQRRIEIAFNALTWYQIEGRDLDYAAQRFDLYVNRQLVQAGVPFRASAAYLDRLVLYSVSSGAITHIDEIELWQ